MLVRRLKVLFRLVVAMASICSPAFCPGDAAAAFHRCLGELGGVGRYPGGDFPVICVGRQILPLPSSERNKSACGCRALRNSFRSSSSSVCPGIRRVASRAWRIWPRMRRLSALRSSYYVPRMNGSPSAKIFSSSLVFWVVTRCSSSADKPAQNSGFCTHDAQGVFRRVYHEQRFGGDLSCPSGWR